MTDEPANAQGGTTLEQKITWTATTPKSVYTAIKDSWDTAKMGGAATPRAIVVLLSQWHLETEVGKHCYNNNLAGMKCPNPTAQSHFYMNTMEDYPADKANAMVAARKAYFKADKNDAATGKLRVWFGKGCFRAWDNLSDGAKGYLGVVSGFYREALPFILAGDAGGYAHAICEEVRGAGRGWFTGPDAIYKDGKPWGGYRFALKRFHREYMDLKPDTW